MGELTGSLIPSKSRCAFSDGFLAARAARQELMSRFVKILLDVETFVAA
jgi:hypothetical protein